MDCTDEAIRELIPDFVSGDLGTAEAKTIGEHIAICPSCKEYADHVRWITQGLKQLTSQESQNHPSIDALVDYIRAPESLPDNDRRQLTLHLTVCPSCQGVCESIAAVQKDLDLSGTITITALMPVASGPPAYHLAADTGTEETLSVKCLATFYSEKPEVVLRVMRDFERNQDYLEVMADDPEALAYAMLHSPELGRDFIADSKGRAEIDLSGIDDVTGLTWQVNAPQAVFTLDPLEYDPEKTEYSDATVLETDRGDRIEIRFEGKTEGKTISVKVLELEGRSDYGSLRVSLAHEQCPLVGIVKPGLAIQLGPIDCDSEIKIHLYE